MDAFSFITIMAVVVPFQLCTIYFLMSLNKIFRKVFKYMDKFMESPVVQKSGGFCDLDNETIANICSVVKKII